MSEILTADNWIYDTLVADATIVAGVSTRVYGHVAPIDSVFPYIVFKPAETSIDLMVVNAKRVWSDGLWLVIVVGKTQTFSTLQTVADRIDTLLHRASGAGVQTSVRERPFSMVEIVDGVQYRHLGGVYRIQVS